MYYSRATSFQKLQYFKVFQVKKIKQKTKISNKECGRDEGQLHFVILCTIILKSFFKVKNSESNYTDGSIWCCFEILGMYEQITFCNRETIKRRLFFYSENGDVWCFIKIFVKSLYESHERKSLMLGA